MLIEIISLLAASYLVNGCASQKYKGMAIKKQEFKTDAEFKKWYQKEKKSIEGELNIIEDLFEMWRMGGWDERKNIQPELDKLTNNYHIFSVKVLEYKKPKINKNEKCFTGDWDGYHCEQKKTLDYCDNSKKINPKNKDKVLNCCGDICKTLIELNEIKNKLTEYKNKLA